MPEPERWALQRPLHDGVESRKQMIAAVHDLIEAWQISLIEAGYQRGIGPIALQAGRNDDGKTLLRVEGLVVPRSGP